MEIIELNKILQSLLYGRAVSEINQYENFSISLIATKNSIGIPPSIRVLMKSDWYILEVGRWEEVNKKFPTDTSQLGEPYKPLKAFYIDFISQNRAISNIFIKEDFSLIIEFNKEYTLVVPPECEYYDLSWIIDADNDKRFPDFSIAFNNEENRLYSSVDSISWTPS